MELIKMLGIFLTIAALTVFGLTILHANYVCYKRRKRKEERNGFGRLMQEMLELDADRLKTQEDLLWEACRSWAVSDSKEEE